MHISDLKISNPKSAARSAGGQALSLPANLSNHRSDKMKRFFLAVLLAAALPASAAIDIESIAPAGFSRGVAMTVNGYTGTSTLENFPVLVRISESSISGFDYDDMMFGWDGTDIAFTDAEGNPLAYEIDTWVENGESLVWVRLPEVTQGTEFGFFYHSADSGKLLESESPFSEYTGVWHLNETGSGQDETIIYDASTNNLLGVAAGIAASRTNGKVGGAWQINNAYLRQDTAIRIDCSEPAKKAATDLLGSDFTVSTWLLPLGKIGTKSGIAWNVLMSRRSTFDTPAWGLQFHENAKVLRVSSSSTGNGNWSTETLDAIAQNQWGKLDVVYHGTKFDLYFNGSPVAMNAALHGNLPAQQGTEPIMLGNMSQLMSERAFWGELDEVRLSPGFRSSDWVKADFDTVNSSDFLQAGEVVQIVETSHPPVLSSEVVDIGAAFIQFEGRIATCGGSADTCSVWARATKVGGTAPGWTCLATGLERHDLYSVLLTGLEPDSRYQWEIKAVSDDSTAGDSEIRTGLLTSSGVGDLGSGGTVNRVGDEFIHTFLVNERGTTTFEFHPPEEVSEIEILLVGGGGPGGYNCGGGGGAGGLFYTNAYPIIGGEIYTVTVGAGGVAAGSDVAWDSDSHGSNGGSSSLALGSEVLLSVPGGGAGGNGHDTLTLSSGCGADGGSGGGAALVGMSGGVPTQQGAGQAGGTTTLAKHAAGGGGANEAAVTVVQSGGVQSSGSGGTGRLLEISGAPRYYAGGGGGGGAQSGNAGSYGAAGSGGSGGGGTGGQRRAENDPSGYEYAQDGVDGLGGGGGGGSHTEPVDGGRDPRKGGDGGDGVVIIRYGSPGNGADWPSPVVTLISADYDSANETVTVSWRLNWAGLSYQTADIDAIWSYSRSEQATWTSIPITTDSIGRGTATFPLPLSRNAFLRISARNAANLTSKSAETVTLVVQSAESVSSGFLAF